MERMEKLFKRYRCLLGVPRPGFIKSLKKKVLQRFSLSTDFFGESLPHLLPITPAHDFRVRLRNELLEKELDEENFFSRFFQKYSFPFRLLRNTISITVSFCIFLSAVLFGVYPQSQASSSTLITAFVGEVFVTHENEDEALLPSVILIGEQTTIRTGEDSSATIRFFEDSVLRLDANTTLLIETLDPHPMQNDLGEVRVVLESGRVWGKTFSLDEDYSQFHIVLPNNQISLDSGGAVDIFTSGNIQIIRSWDRLVRIRGSEGGGFVLQGGEQITQGIRNATVSAIPETEAKSDWVLKNKIWDEEISAFFVEEKIKQKKKEVASTFKKLREAFVSRFSRSAETEILELEFVFLDSLAEISAQFDESNQDFLADFREKSRKLSVNHFDELHVFFASAEKTLHSVLPDSPLFVAKKEVESLQAEFIKKQDQILFAEKQRTRRLWEATLLADAGEMALAEEIVRNSSEGGVGEAIPAEVTADILSERQEQMVALGKMEENGELEEIAGQIENELIEKTSALVRPGFPTGRVRTATEQAYDIISRMKKYESDQGRRNSVRVQLENIDNTAESIPLLMEVKNRLPDDMESIVSQKILNIMGEESIRAKNETIFSIEN